MKDGRHRRPVHWILPFFFAMALVTPVLHAHEHVHACDEEHEVELHVECALCIVLQSVKYVIDSPPDVCAEAIPEHPENPLSFRNEILIFPDDRPGAGPRAPPTLC